MSSEVRWVHLPDTHRHEMAQKETNKNKIFDNTTNISMTQNDAKMAHF